MAKNEWSTMLTLLEERAYASMTYNEKVDTVYLIGGQKSTSGGSSKKIMKYSFDETKGWEYTATDTPKTPIYQTVVSYGWFIYSYGITVEEGSKSELMAMDVRTESWQIYDTQRKVEGMLIKK